MYEISYIDTIVTPLTIILVILLSKKLSKTLCKYSKIQKYYLPSLYLRFVCTFLTFVLYTYYYGYGDTFEYYKGGEIIKSAFLNGDIGAGFELLFKNYDDFSKIALSYVGEHWYFEVESNRIIIIFSAFFSFFTFSSFLSIAILFTFLAFIGSWLIFISLYELTKNDITSLAYSTLFVPSYIFWGTGIMKEPICIFALGCFFYTSQKIIMDKIFKFKYILFLVIGFLLLFIVKVYILICFIIALFILITIQYISYFKSTKFPLLSKFLIISFFCVIAFQAWTLITGYYQNFSSLETLLDQIDYTQSAQIINSEGGSGYDLGEIKMTTLGILNYVLLSINVTLFRPYLWEINKIVNIPITFESLFMFFFLIQTIIKVGLVKTFKIIFSKSDVMFCVIFTLILSIMIGAISFNFGTLARYRIPMLPFYFTSLLLIRDYGKNITTK